ncbi:MAG: glycine cleavage T C-terminal barrel domain-containing protein, partial [Paracoccaceae bacterium]
WGRLAVEKQRQGGLSKMLATFAADGAVILSGRETIYRDGQRVGWLSSAGFGHSIGKSIGLGYIRDAGGVDADYVRAGRYELEVAGERVPCSVHLAPLHDPKMKNVKC